MTARLAFPLIALFWATMNVLLWRAEFGGGKEPGSRVSPEMVWEKILNAPDDSKLEISRNGKKIGYCRWIPNVSEELTRGKAPRDDLELEGMVKRVSGYAIDLEGNVLVGDPGTRMRFATRLRFSTDHAWQELSIRVAHRPVFWEIHTAAAGETLSLRYEDGEGKWSRMFRFDELRDPRALLEEFGSPGASALFGFATGMADGDPLRNMTTGLNWEARSDTLKIGHSSARVYRLQARLLDRYQIVITVSRIGEILRVELPNGFDLVNEALASL